MKCCDNVVTLIIKKLGLCGGRGEWIIDGCTGRGGGCGGWGSKIVPDLLIDLFDFFCLLLFCFALYWLIFFLSLFLFFVCLQILKRRSVTERGVFLT